MERAERQQDQGPEVRGLAVRGGLRVPLHVRADTLTYADVCSSGARADREGTIDHEHSLPPPKKTKPGNPFAPGHPASLPENSPRMTQGEEEEDDVGDGDAVLVTDADSSVGEQVVLQLILAR
jgi:hypothetical protein